MDNQKKQDTSTKKTFATDSSKNASQITHKSISITDASNIIRMSERVEYRCFVCGRQFSTLGAMQTHVVVEHLQKPDFIDEIGKKKAFAA